LIEDAQAGDGGASANLADYRWVFLQRVHGVLQAGYLRLNASDYAAADEPTISGVLAGCMRAFLREDVPDWADHFSIHDDPPVSDGVRTGKRRKRIDIGVESAVPRPGQRFSFEAKRLGAEHPIGIYLGPEGLGCFLAGDYARNDDSAGMIGYVQSHTPFHWASQLEHRLRLGPAAYHTSTERCWKKHLFVDGPQHCFVSHHERAILARPITIYHSLLSFVAS